MQILGGSDIIQQRHRNTTHVGKIGIEGQPKQHIFLNEDQVAARKVPASVSSLRYNRHLAAAERNNADRGGCGIGCIRDYHPLPAWQDLRPVVPSWTFDSLHRSTGSGHADQPADWV